MQVSMYDSISAKYPELATEIGIKSEVTRSLKDGRWSMAS